MPNMHMAYNTIDACAGKFPDFSLNGEMRITVRREGASHVRHVFISDNKPIAHLLWKGQRRAIYEAEGVRYYINISPLDRRISIICKEGKESSIYEKARSNRKREELFVQMAEGDLFELTRFCHPAREENSLALRKKYYQTTLLLFSFNIHRRTQTTVKINVTPAIKWEARFFHRLLALVVCRVILERRRSGAQPLRIKEKECHSPCGARVRQRKRLWV